MPAWIRQCICVCVCMPVCFVWFGFECDCLSKFEFACLLQGQIQDFARDAGGGGREQRLRVADVAK